LTTFALPQDGDVTLICVVVVVADEPEDVDEESKELGI